MRKQKKFGLILVITVCMILVTRLVTLTHNMDLHPDEFVFFEAADSLKSFLAGTAEKYTEVKPYPEGAIVLQTPFHIIGAAIRHVTGFAVSSRLCGRLAAVFFYAVGVVLGGIVLHRHVDSRETALCHYALLTVFSLIHIEQSRYGTGDAISFCLLMGIILLSAAGTKSKTRYLYGACLLAGMLGAVKYPLLLFAAIPVAAFLLRDRGQSAGTRVKTGLAMPVLVVLGFLLLSPGVVEDPDYIRRVIELESGAYINGGNICEVGGFWNHLLSVSIYFLLYAGIPLAPVFLAGNFLRRGKARRRGGEKDPLFTRVIPCLMLVFFLYNLFAATLFMRTYYPFFGLADLYVASELADWMEGKRKKAIVCVLTGILVLRGVYYIGALTERGGAGRMTEILENTVGDGWNRTTLLGPGYFLGIDGKYGKDAQTPDIDDARYQDADDLRLGQGELVICATQEHSRCNPYFFPVNNELANRQIYNWTRFKEINAAYYKGQLYPERYYYLFGYWLKGTTGTDYEFPSNRVYYRDPLE